MLYVRLRWLLSAFKCALNSTTVTLSGTKVTTYSLHPGSIRTELTRHVSIITDYAIGRALYYICSWPLVKEPWNGAQTTICCAVDSSLAAESGKYYRWCSGDATVFAVLLISAHSLIRIVVSVFSSSFFSSSPCKQFVRISQPIAFIARPPTWSSLKITNRFFRYAAPCLWNELPTDLREPCQIQFPSLSPITHGTLSSSSSPSSLSPLASSLTRSVFHSELKTWLFGKSFPPQTFSFPAGLILRTLGPFNVFILLSGWICLHGVLD